MAAVAEPTIIGLDVERVHQLISSDTDPAGPFTLSDTLLMLGGLVARYHAKFDAYSYGGAGMRVHEVKVVGGAPSGSSEWGEGSIKVRLDGDYGYDTQSWWAEGYIDAQGHFKRTDGFN